MNVLAIDTATEVCGIGLLLDDGKWLDHSQKTGLNHTGKVLEGVHRVLGDAGVSVPELDLIVCSRGPGSFTGLRIGMATAKGLAAGAGLPLASVPALDAMTYAFAWASETVVPVIDAKKNRVYTAVYRNGEKQRGPLDLATDKIAALLGELDSVILTGPGAELAAAQCRSLGRISVDRRRSGWNQAYIDLGIARFRHSGSDTLDAGPEYLRKSDAELLLDGGALDV